MAFDALAILNDPTYVPLVAGSGDPLVGSNSADGEFYIVVSTTLRVRDQFGNRNWLKFPEDRHRGGGRP